MGADPVHYSKPMQEDDLDQKIGARIKTERESRNWSLTDLAERAGVSRAMIHKIERGESSPTAKLLGKLSGAFQMTMSTLMARAEAEGGHLLRREAQPVWTDPETGYIRRHVSPKTQIPFDLVEVTLPAGAVVPMPAAAYAFFEQLIWVREGTLTFQEGNVHHKLGAGDCLHLGPPTDCVFENASDAPCTYAVMLLRHSGPLTTNPQ